MNKISLQYKEFATKAIKNNNPEDCLKYCFKYLSINPREKWPYILAAQSYLNLKMFSQSRGCYSVSQYLDDNKLLYEKLINISFIKENKNEKNSN